ncbi:hypothetical protein UNDYM_0248 [Undibacterium sp. YM2]|jgi:hypothetical protein|nr:hypothetical protein UNDYM_0248 [Undibacterium sp. YM2]
MTLLATVSAALMPGTAAIDNAAIADKKMNLILLTRLLEVRDMDVSDMACSFKWLKADLRFALLMRSE